MEQEKERKKQLIESAGIASPRFLSFYLDEIGKTVPKTIHLQELQLFPLLKKLKNKQKVEVKKDEILLLGTTKDNVTLDNWIEKIDRFDWVKSVELLNYQYNDNNLAVFKLLINLDT